MKGLYICKTYLYSSDLSKIIPVLKYGRTNNIETRMLHYNKIAPYKLLVFFPCKDFIDLRENLIQREYDEYRLNKSEHIIYKSGLFKQLYRQVKDAASCKITKSKNKNGAIIHAIEDDTL
jgi:hypothetical protein